MAPVEVYLDGERYETISDDGGESFVFVDKNSGKVRPDFTVVSKGQQVILKTGSGDITPTIPVGTTWKHEFQRDGTLFGSLQVIVQHILELKRT
jgi:hypothetical protein